MIGMCKPELLWSGSGYFFKGFDQVTAVGKAGILADVGQIEAGEQEIILDLGNPYEFNVILTGLSIQPAEAGGKIRIAHPAAQSQILDQQRFI